MDALLSPDVQISAAFSAARGDGPRPGASSTPEAARAAAEDFEAFFLSQMLEAMFAGVGENNPFGGGPGERAFTGLLNEEYARVMSRAGGLGLSDRLTAEILRYQEEGAL